MVVVVVACFIISTHRTHTESGGTNDGIKSTTSHRPW